jgi:hypothetical protein
LTISRRVLTGSWYSLSLAPLERTLLK